MDHLGHRADRGRAGELDSGEEQPPDRRDIENRRTAAGRNQPTDRQGRKARDETRDPGRDAGTKKHDHSGSVSMPDAVDEVPGTAETGRDEPLCSIVRPCCGRGPGHSCPIVFEHPLKLDDNTQLFTGSIRNHPAGIAPDSLIRLSPSPYRKIRAEFYVKTPLGSNSKFQYSFQGLRVLRPTLDTGFAPLLLLSSFFSTFFLSPSPRSLVFGPPLPVSPSSHPSLILPCRLHPPRCKLTFAVYLPWGSTPDLNTHRTLRRHSALTPREYSTPTPSGVHR